MKDGKAEDVVVFPDSLVVVSPFLVTGVVELMVVDVDLVRGAT